MIEPIHILILEDNPMDAELMICALKKEGLQFTNTIVNNRNDFIEALNNETFDLILSDNSLPQFDATEAVQIVRKSFPHLPFILVTGTVNEEFVISIMKLGIDDYILKDRLARLPSAIKSALEKRQSEREKKEAERKLIESEQNYRSMIERISDGFFVLNKEWNFQYVNSVAAVMFNKDSNELIGKNIWTEFPETAGMPVHDSLQEAFATQKEIFYEGFAPYFQRWVQLSAYPSIEGIVVYYRDITEKKEAELLAKESEDVRNLIMSSALDAIVCVNHANKFIFWNRRAEELFGWTFEEVQTKTFETTIIPKNFRHGHTHAMQRYIETGESHVAGKMLELTALNKAGKEFPIELFMIPVKTGKTEFFCAFIRDISERKKLEHKLLEQQKKAAKEITATALEAQEKERNHLGQELHDNVNQILVSTKMLLQMAMGNIDKNKHLLDKCLESLNDVIVENRKLAHEMVTPNIEHESIHNLLQGLTEDMFVSDLPKVTVRVNPGADRQLHSKQKLTLYRIAQEQCSNILKYANASEMEIVVEEKNEAVEMTIHDNGQGMDAEKKPNGIGLRNINSRLSIYNGTSKIITGPGKGFTLTVQIPFSAA